MFYYLRLNMKVNSSSGLNATSTDCYFDFMVRSIYDKSKKVINANDKQKALISYLTGELIPFNSNWGEVEHVLIPIFMDKKAHWILGHLDVANWHMDVYNSSFKTIRDNSVLDTVEPLRNVIPHLLRSSKVLKFEPPEVPLYCRLCKDIPHQTNGKDAVIEDDAECSIN
ncbi:Ulp1 protease family [Abeliophyllum distichum]|uniref:Ulp1 protease family n=1 Tax=Abeliophyllum distichum TaxID=126358 RepID=A0ABD1U3F7_9LAMI